jgi:Cu+-exporting ATPase
MIGNVLMSRTNINIEGMHCASCALNIEKALGKAQGVKSVSVNFATEKAYVDFDPAVISWGDIEEVIHNTGYEVRAELEKVLLPVGGMHCASCAANIEKALRKTDGVKEASVNLASEQASVVFDSQSIVLSDLKGVIEGIGYEVIPERSVEAVAGEEGDLGEMRSARKRMLLAWIFTVPVMAWMSLEMFFGITWPDRGIYTVIMLLLAAPVVFVIGRATQRSALKSIVHGQTNMDVLIMLGTTVAFITGILSLFTGIRSFAAISAMIMAIHLTGRAIESAARGRASQAIKKLLRLGAKTATVQRNGEEREIPIEEVLIDDIMIVRPGEKMPTDGVIVEGESALDESMVTGESMPINRGSGDQVIGATVNQEGLLRVRATKVGKDTFLSHVIRLVEEAQGTKVPIQEFADRVTAVFVPVVLGIAVLTFLTWLLAPNVFLPIARWTSTILPWVNPGLGRVTLAFFAAVAVLVIACPCALGLATPTALMVGTGMGARAGVLIRKGEAIQTLKDVDIIVFDKTGTLTRGTPQVTDVIPVSGFDEKELLRIAASVESGSEHPIGKAVVKRANDMGIELTGIGRLVARRGKGVEAEVEGMRVVIGNRALIGEAGLAMGELEREITRIESEAKTVIIVAREDEIAGCIAVADTLKEDADKAVRELNSLGIETAMITGDNRRTAEAIAEEAGISRVLAEVLPEGKVQEVRNLQSSRRTVAMVGDGINDAPALTQANVGIAIGSGTDIAIEASDITLVRSDLGGVITAVKLSRATFRKIRQNLFWAYFYNIIAIPAAILGLLHPVIAEAAMAMSSINVVTNANLLRFADIRPDYVSAGNRD